MSNSRSNGVEELVGNSPLMSLSETDIHLKRQKFKLEKTRELFIAYRNDRAQYDGLVSEYTHKQLTSYGVVARLGEEYDLAIDLFSRANQGEQRKVTEWIVSGEPISTLAGSIEEYTSQKYPGIFINLGMIEEANVFRRIERKESRRDGDFEGAAEISYRLQDWQGLARDVERGGYDIYHSKGNNLVTFARVAKKRNSDASQRIYKVARIMAKENEDWPLYAMLCAESGKKKTAIKYYEQEGRFIPALNLRINQSLPVKKAKRRVFDKAFFEERMNAPYEDFEADEMLRIKREKEHWGENAGVDERIVHPLEKSLKYAKRYGLESVLERKLRRDGEYGMLKRLADEHVFEWEHDYSKIVEMLNNVKEKLSLDQWMDFYPSGRKGFRHLYPLVSDLKDSDKVDELWKNQDPRTFFRLLGIPRDVADTLIIDYITRLGSEGKSFEILDRNSNYNTRTHYGGDEPGVFHDFGLKTVKSLYECRRHGFLVEKIPSLIREYDSSCSFDVDGSRNRFVTEELERQDTIRNILRKAGQKVRVESQRLFVDISNFIDFMPYVVKGRLGVDQFGCDLEVDEFDDPF